MQSLMTISDLEVDHIIEKVLIRNNNQPYRYNQPHHQLTPSSHIWHFQLQEENQELKNKVKDLQLKLKRKEDGLHRHEYLAKEVQNLKHQLDQVLHQNTHLQRDINRLRVRNTHQISRRQLEQSLRRSKSKRQCSCSQSKIARSSPKIKQHPKRQVLTESDSSPRANPKSYQDVSITCRIQYQSSAFREELNRKKNTIQNIKQLIKNQQKLMSSYQLQLSRKQENAMDRKNTRPSTCRLLAPDKFGSMTAFKHQPSAGSIVKVKKSTRQ